MKKKASNRIKAVLAERGKTNNWLAEELGKIEQLFRNGALTKCNRQWKLFLKLLMSWI